jgi:AraC-like DNA-binding protein
MTVRSKKPAVVVQNRLQSLLSSEQMRRQFYGDLLDRRLGRSAAVARSLRVPRLRGMRLRSAGKPFHATPELFFQEAGTTRFRLPEERLTLRAGHEALIPAGMPHGEVWQGREFLNVIMMIQEDGFSLHLGFVDGGPRCGPVDRFRSDARLTLIRYAEELAEAPAATFGRRLREGIYLALLARLREGLNRGALSAPCDSPLLQRCLTLIDVHFARMDFSVIWLARELSCSADHLSRTFRRRTGQRLISFIHQKRIEHARRLLRASDMNIAETAWACGFSQASYFNRIFRAYTATPPLLYRAATTENT